MLLRKEHHPKGISTCASVSMFRQEEYKECSKIYTIERRKISLLKDENIRRPYEEKVIELVDVGVPIL